MQSPFRLDRMSYFKCLGLYLVFINVNFPIPIPGARKFFFMVSQALSVPVLSNF